jgi:hypothetical protein
MKGINKMFKLSTTKCKIEKKAKELIKGMTKKDCGGKEIISEIGLVVVAVTLLLIFRTQISGIITTIMANASTEINSLFS